MSVVDFSQTMELPVYKNQQPGCTYYFSPFSVYNLGVIDHAHTSLNGEVGEHMYSHVYHKGVKKGANNLASLVMKTFVPLNLLHYDCVEMELNMVFDNCLGQKKKMIKLDAFLTEIGLFQAGELHFPHCWTHYERMLLPIQFTQNGVSAV